MSNILAHLEPKEVFRYFEELAAIPHGSGNTKQIADYCEQFAKDRGLPHARDAHDNVVIIREAAAGYETAAPVLLQGHLDMVCEKAPGCRKDMEKEGLDLAEENGWVYAKGTTLGGDDGIAVAMMLALLAEKELPAPRLECIITSDEEVGMLGAAAWQPTLITGRNMINLDSEEEGIFTVSCAGGNRTYCRLPITREPVTGQAVTVKIAGLVGGHSGVEINKGRANADMLLGRLLTAIRSAMPCHILSVAGGQKDNAIPTEAEAGLFCGNTAALTALAAEWQTRLRHEYAPIEPGLTVTVAAHGEKTAAALTEESADRVLCLLLCVPNGVQAMSGSLPGLVQTSLNLGILATEADSVVATFCVRSNMNTQKEMLLQKLELLCDLLGGKMSVSGSYPAWEFREDSPLRALIVEVFTEQYGHAPKIEVLHGGVECGMLADKLPGLDAVAMGPEVSQIHTPRERMYISSVQRTWNLVVETLRRLR